MSLQMIADQSTWPIAGWPGQDGVIAGGLRRSCTCNRVVSRILLVNYLSSHARVSLCDSGVSVADGTGRVQVAGTRTSYEYKCAGSGND